MKTETQSPRALRSGEDDAQTGFVLKVGQPGTLTNCPEYQCGQTRDKNAKLRKIISAVGNASAVF